MTRMMQIALVGIITLSGAMAHAATQGSLGTTSTGTIDVSAQKLAGVRISGLADIVFPASATAPAAQADALCIYATPGTYTIRATSSNAVGTTFRLHSTASNYISYGVTWYNAEASGTATALGSGQVSSTITNGNQTATDCGGTNNARVELAVDGPTFLSAPVGTYTDTLTLLVAPQ